MGASYTIEGHVAEFTITGRFSAKEVLDQVETCLLDPQLPPKARVLFDVSKSQELKTHADIQQLVAAFGRGAAKLDRIAILVEQTHRYGVARQFGSLLATYHIPSAPFYDRDEALKWLESQTAGATWER